MDAKKINISFLKLTFIVFFILLPPFYSFAGVNLKNGNFYLSYTDVIQPGDLEVHRTYNSKSVWHGIFGFGWGSEFETYITVNGDGTITIKENGSGSRSDYFPINYDANTVTPMLDQMLSVYIESGSIVGEKENVEMRGKLQNDRELRNSNWDELVKKNKVIQPFIVNGSRFYKIDSPSKILQKTATGYIRKTSNGITERFNLQGYLVRESHSNGQYLHISRNKLGHIRKISNQLGSVIYVETDQKGRVTTLTGKNGRKSYYQYHNKNLIENTNAAATKFRYKYDDNHNLTQVIYEDDSTLDMTYATKTQFLERIKTRTGDLTHYEYFDENLNTIGNLEHKYGKIIKQYGTIVKKGEIENDDDSYYSMNSYFYTVSQNSLGNTWSSNITTIVNDIETSTDYHPCGNALKIVRGSRTTLFDYDSKCRLIFKKSSTENTRIHYDAKFGKIAYVSNLNSDDEITSESWFQYNAKGKLSIAKNSKGRSASLTYNETDDIIKMIDDKNQTLRFQYNRLGKPIKIVLESVGTLNVEYDDYGEITTVNSDEGHKMALKITMMFQNLLSLTKPSGVNFNL